MTTWGDVASLTWAELGAYTWAELIERGISIEIAGVVIGQPLLDTLSIDNRIEERSTASFQILDNGSGYAFEYGQEVIIYDYDENIVFGGIISEAKKKSPAAPSWGWMVHHIDCVDYHALADRRTFLGAYEEATGAEIIYDVLEVLAEEGITEGEIQPGAELENISFNRVMCTEVLEKVSELCGYTWFISEEKKLYFVARGTYAAA